MMQGPVLLDVGAGVGWEAGFTLLSEISYGATPGHYAVPLGGLNLGSDYLMLGIGDLTTGVGAQDQVFMIANYDGTAVVININENVATTGVHSFIAGRNDDGVHYGCVSHFSFVSGGTRSVAWGGTPQEIGIGGRNDASSPPPAQPFQGTTANAYFIKGANRMGQSAVVAIRRQALYMLRYFLTVEMLQAINGINGPIVDGFLYPMRQGQRVERDYSGRANHGTLSGGTTIVSDLGLIDAPRDPQPMPQPIPITQTIVSPHEALQHVEQVA